MLFMGNKRALPSSLQPRYSVLYAKFLKIVKLQYSRMVRISSKLLKTLCLSIPKEKVERQVNV